MRNLCRADYIVDFLGELVNWDFVNEQFAAVLLNVTVLVSRHESHQMPGWVGTCNSTRAGAGHEMLNLICTPTCRPSKLANGAVCRSPPVLEGFIRLSINQNTERVASVALCILSRSRPTETCRSRSSLTALRASDLSFPKRLPGWHGCNLSRWACMPTFTLSFLRHVYGYDRTGKGK